MQDPKRIFNSDESNIQLAPPTGKVISLTGWKNVYELAPGPEKSNLTFLGTYNAAGETVTPLIVYPYVRLPSEIASKIPDSFEVALTESGWMTSKLFYEFMANTFIPWLSRNEVPKPVILFVDGHKTHLTLQTSVLCEDNGVVLYLLPPNTTHILQPADVGPFRPMKHYWREEVIQFQRNNPGLMITRKDVAPLLERVLQKVASTSIKNGFRKTGLYPFNVEAVDFSRCLDILTEDCDEDSNQELLEIREKRDYKEAFACVKEVLGNEDLDKCLKKELSVARLYELVEIIGSRAGLIEDQLETVEMADVEITEERGLTGLEVASTVEHGPLLPAETSSGELDPTISEGISMEEVSVGTNAEDNIHNNSIIVESNSENNPETPFSVDDFESNFTITIPDIDLSSLDDTINLNDNIITITERENLNSVSPTNQDSPIQEIEFAGFASISNKATMDENKMNREINNNIFVAKNQNRTSNIGEASSSLSSSIYKYFPGKVVYKKRKTPTSPQKSIVSAKSFRLQTLNKQKTKKNKADDWICEYCKISYDEDLSSDRGNRKWIGCDNCHLKQHITCLPRAHLSAQNFDIEEDENDFLCERCFSE